MDNIPIDWLCDHTGMKVRKCDCRLCNLEKVGVNCRGRLEVN